MIQLLKRMRRREALMALLCAVLVVGQVYFDLRLPDYMTELTKLIKTPGSSTGDILSVGGEMLLCTLCSAVLAVGCGYLSARTAAGFSFSVRRDLFHHVMDAGSEEMQTFSVPSLITRTTNDITQIQMIVAMGLQMLMKAPIMAVWAVIKILGKSWTLSAVTAGFVVALVTLVLLIMSSCLPRFRRVQKKTDEINRVARENLTGINVVHAFGAEDYQNKKFDGPSRDMMDLQLKNQRLFALLQPAMGLGMNGLALAIYWVTVALLATIGLPPEVVVVLDVLFRLFAVLALIAACVVICYKGVVFSCTSQPGLKKARWLTCWVASDALTMGMGLLIVLSLVFGQIAAVEALIIPFITLIVFRCFTYALVWMNIHERASKMYSKAVLAGNAIVVYGIAGICAIAACFFGPLGAAAAGVLCLLAGVWERYWVIYVAHPH